MSKLSETTKKARKFLIGFLVFAIGVIIFQQVQKYINSQNSPLGGSSNANLYAPVDNLFGEIEYPEITSLAIQKGTNPTFSILGNFGESPASVNIYEVQKPRETLGSVVKAEDIATSLNFTGDYEVKDNSLIWRTGKKALTIDKVTGNTLYQDLGIDINTLRNNKPSIVDEDNISRILIQSLSILKQPITTQIEVNRNYLVADNLKFQTTQNANNADFIRQDYFNTYEIVSTRETQSNTDKVSTPIQGSIHTDDPRKGIMSLIIKNISYTGSFNENYIREYSQIGLEVKLNKKGVYELKTQEEAWEDVKDGKASLKYLVLEGADPLDDYKELEVKRFVVDPNKSKLGFFLPDSWKGYIYPIYYFAGSAELVDGTKAEFVFYAKAIK